MTAEEGPQRKKRTVNSCLRCRRIKLKCDHGTPCGSCTRSGVTGECIYQDPDRNVIGDVVLEPPRRRAVRVCKRCHRLKLKCDKGKPCRSCLRSAEDCVYERTASKSPPRRVQRTYPAHLANGADAPSYSSPRHPDFASKLRATIARFPSPAICLQLVDEFLHFDVMFRLTIAPVFKRRMSYLVTYFPRCEEQHVPLLCMLCSTMIIGYSYYDKKETLPVTKDELWSINHDLIQLMDNPRSYPEQHQVDFCEAHLLCTYALSVGPGTSPGAGWLANGRLYHAALLVGLPKIHDETLYTQERRRRIWWSLVNHKRQLSHILRIPPGPCTHPVPRPAMVTDESLAKMYDAELAGTPLADFPEDSGTCEWAYVHYTADWWAAQLQVGQIMDPSFPSASIKDKLDAAHTVYDDFNATLPPHLQLHDPSPQDPPWVFAQACAMLITTAHAVIDLYRPYFLVEAVALRRALHAAENLINTAQALTAFLMFRWIDAQSAQLWEFGSKVFNGGLTMAYALLQGSHDWDSDEGFEASPATETSAHARRTQQQTALDTAIGALRACANQKVECNDLSRKSLKVLEILRSVIIQRQAGKEPSHDPYSEIIGVLNQDNTEELEDWVKWDGIFQELFTGYNDILEGIA